MSPSFLISTSLSLSVSTSPALWRLLLFLSFCLMGDGVVNSSSGSTLRLWSNSAHTLLHLSAASKMRTRLSLLATDVGLHSNRTRRHSHAYTVSRRRHPSITYPLWEARRSYNAYPPTVAPGGVSIHNQVTKLHAKHEGAENYQRTRGQR